MAVRKLVPIEKIEKKIHFVRGKRVMVDADLAKLYGVTTSQLNQQVRRNMGRFPPDFMFQMTMEEKDEVVTNCDNLGKLRFSPHLPLAFTEFGAVMLANVLNCPKAIWVSIQIVRTFARMRVILASNAEIEKRLDQLEKKYDEQFQIVFDSIRQLLHSAEKPKNPMGFVREKKAQYKTNKRHK